MANLISESALNLAVINGLKISERSSAANSVDKRPEQLGAPLATRAESFPKNAFPDSLNRV
jgi:hypothetical protein